MKILHINTMLQNKHVNTNKNEQILVKILLYVNRERFTI